MDYARAIRIGRAAKGISQKELADRSGLDPSYISLIESGRRTPGAAATEAIAANLGIPLFLLILLGADDRELAGISREQAGEISQALLDAIASGPKD